jgi:hypothetical protein
MAGQFQARDKAAMVAFLAPALDYEFVIFLLGGRDFGFPEFISWSAQMPPQPESLNPFTAKETIMKTTTLFAALAFGFAASGAALAQEGNDRDAPFTAQKTRAEVIAEFKLARDAGLIQMTEGESLVRTTPLASKLTRAEVHAQAAAAVASGELRALGHEGYAYAPVRMAKASRGASAE